MTEIVMKIQELILLFSLWMFEILKVKKFTHP